jgi:hypothetical protein
MVRATQIERSFVWFLCTSADKLINPRYSRVQMRSGPPFDESATLQSDRLMSVDCNYSSLTQKA